MLADVNDTPVGDGNGAAVALPDDDDDNDIGLGNGAAVAVTIGVDTLGNGIIDNDNPWLLDNMLLLLLPLLPAVP